MSRQLRSAHSGLTLIELMIAMALGLVLVLGVINIYLSQRESFRVNENLSHMQENARIAFELMARDIREAGGNPCGTPLVANVLENSTNFWLDWEIGGIQGFESNVALAAAANRVAGDAIVLRGAQMGSELTIAEHTPSSANFTVNGAHSFNVGDVLMACDYKQAAIFRVSAANSSNRTVGHNTGNIKDPGSGAELSKNCSKDLTFGAACSATTCSASDACKSFDAGGFVSRMVTTIWYVGTNARGGRSLFRIENGAAQEIAEGVTDMELQYLTRTGNNLAPNYVDASAVGSWSNTAAAQVVAVRVVLNVESRESVGTDAATLKRPLMHVVSLRHREIVQ